ncbi:MAG: copper chaperone PCu(A)C [Gammaproteobacteria bacterium]|nr:copper chaperone PCu(A)C [Gammaproteobacteria bacterium]NIR99252.1 copper chaperone PCu(A)C [Gammaproteobacteria bacterium]NIT64873.1 copper chaperone PCu(A)C [Gammaproteobacteria bacterium]NIV21823.1 copper chaperone PCu(A)C [Gammaproteobacteria bacterium]NIX10892.1 copper chaperone PCu(A)C [Gammaproteobacteria bacterium]
MQQRLIRSLAVIGALLLVGGVMAGGIEFEDPWIREAPPGAPSLAGYMVVKNPSAEGRSLVGATSPAFGKVTLHRTEMEEGMARMVHQERVEVPAGGAVRFEPEGYHLMLMKPVEALKAGDRVEITLRFEDGESVPVTFEVRKDVGAGHMQHQQMQHGQ